MKLHTLIEKAFLLKKTPMFSLLELDLLLPIADKLSPIAIDAGEIIFDCGEQAYSMYLIADGVVTVHDAENRELTILKAGEFFGEESIFSRTPRAYRTSTKTDTICLTLSQSDLLAIINEYPRVATGFLEVYTKAMPYRKRTE